MYSILIRNVSEILIFPDINVINHVLFFITRPMTLCINETHYKKGKLSEQKGKL